MRNADRAFWFMAVVAAWFASPLTAQPLRFDFQPASGPLAGGHIAVTESDSYTSVKGYGFVLPPTHSVDGSNMTWNVFGRIVTVDGAVPASVLSDATRDAVVSEATGGTDPVIEFRADVAPGTYDLTVWLGDVTRPRFRMAVEANGVTGRVTRVDVNDRRGTFDQTQFGSAAPLQLRVAADDGVIVLRVRRDDAAPLDPVFGPLAANGAATAWTFVLDEAKGQPVGQKTAVLVPAFNGVALQALEIVPASPVPLVVNNGILSAPGAAPDPLLQAALAAFNAGDLDTARAAFQGLDGATKPVLKAAGLLWVAGHPAQIRDEPVLLDTAIALLEGALQQNGEDHAASALLLQARMAADVERYRSLLGYQQSGAPATENMGRSSALAEQFADDHPYARKARIVWLRNRGGLDPLRNTVSWERAQWLARQFDLQWGALNPFVHLYATDQWSNNGQPWSRVDWPAVLGDGPTWARNLAGNLNAWLDLFEWWAAHRQSEAGDIGGGWSDDVEIVPAFGLMALALPDASSLSSLAFRRFANGIWQSDIIDPEAGFQAQFADVEHVAEPTGNLLHIQALLDYGAPEPIERMLRSTRTFRDVFLSTPGESPLGHRHVRANFMSATNIAANGNFAADIPLNGRITAPVPFLLWYAANPGVQQPLQAWATSLVADAARTDNGKPAGIFANALWVPNEGIGMPDGNWWGADSSHGQFTAMPTYHWYPYALTGFFAWWTGDASFGRPFDAIQTYTNAWRLAGSPVSGSTPIAGLEDVWVGGVLKGTAIGAITNLRLLNGVSQWNSYLQGFASGYSRFVLNPTSAAPIAGLQATADKLNAAWPYKTSEGVMTDRILEPGWADVLSYYLGADVMALFFGMPAQQVTWENTGRLFAAAVTAAAPGRLDASVYLFSPHSRSIRLRLWQLPPGDYLLNAGPANGLGLPPTVIAQQIPFHIDRRGDRVSVDLPGKTTYAIRIVPAASVPAPAATLATPRPDVAVAGTDLVYDADDRTLTVRVHNIGAIDLFDLTVTVHAGDSELGPVLAEQALPLLPAPLDLSPSSVELVFTDIAPQTAYTVVVQSPQASAEVALDNNRASFSMAAANPALPPVIEQLLPAVGQPGAAITIHGQNFTADMGVLDAGGDNPLLQLLVFSESSAQLVLDPDLPAPSQLLLSLTSPAGIGNTVPLPLLESPSSAQALDPADQYLWLVPPASALAQQGFVRLRNRGSIGGLVQLWGIDDQGRRSSGSVTLSLGPQQSQQLNSQDLELGNPGKGMLGSLGGGSGRWLLVVHSDLDLEVLGYIRTPDGFLTSVHDRNGGDGVDWWVPFFNPAQNPNQVSQLRIVNQEPVPVGIEISGIDDAGIPSAGSVIATITPLSSLQLSATDLEAGGLGDGVGKWQLKVSATGQITVQSLLLDPSGKLTNLSTALASTLDGPRTVGFFPAATNLAQGFVRLINRSNQAGSITITGIDESGQPAPGIATATIGPQQSLQFNSNDLEMGNPGKGLQGSLGTGSGDWRLQIASTLDIVPMALIRTPDGFLTSIHDKVAGDGIDSVVPMFNPAQNPNQVSALRLSNPGVVAASVSISGIDDDGIVAPGVSVTLHLAPGVTRELSAGDLEQGNADAGLVGALGDGNGKWQLHIDASAPIIATHLLRDPNGFITNLSRGTLGGSDSLGSGE